MAPPSPDPGLLLGPLLRYTAETRAAVWVETDRPCEVRVLDAAAHTFSVHGHHYALVEIDGLTAGSRTPYDVRLDGHRVWPDPESTFPPSQIRTPDPAGGLRFVFGSCRVSPAREETHGPDALAAYAHRLASGHPWPDVLLMIGDQVYADETSPQMRAFIEARRDVREPPHDEVADFEEYTQLYRLAWGGDPAVRWLLSTVPTLMIFDDHDVRDDWNTSRAWRERMTAHPWWPRRIGGGLGAYWIYQHLGNLSPQERTADAVYQAVRSSDGDAGAIVDAFAQRADRETAGTRWSYAHDFGGVRLVVVDSRCGRVLEDGHRAMLDETEMAWLEDRCRGADDHLLIATSLPFLLPSAIHHIESWNEALADGAWGRLAARFGERLRQGVDLEHWAAFQKSFRRLAEVLLDCSANVVLLSGDVHYSYLAEVPGARIAQAVCSPMRNPLAGRFRLANQVAAGRVTNLPARAAARLTGVPRPPMPWRTTRGPWYRNAIATVRVAGPRAEVCWEAAEDSEHLTELGRAVL